MLIDDLGDVTEVDLDIGALARQPMGRTIMGGLLVNWSWRFRGSGYASSVGPASFEQFFRRLSAAREELVAALTEDGDDGVAAAFLIRTQKGLQDLAAIDAAFQSLERAARRPIGGYSGYADAISAKWYGSQERMLGFARQHSESLPPASYALIAQAHVETMFSRSRSSNPETAQGARGYLTGDFVRAELIRANEAFSAAARDSDLYANRFAYGQFSYAFMAMGEHDLARPHVQGMGPSPAGPWALLPDPRQALEDVRRLLGVSSL